MSVGGGSLRWEYLKCSLLKLRFLDTVSVPSSFWWARPYHCPLTWSWKGHGEVPPGSRGPGSGRGAASEQPGVQWAPVGAPGASEPPPERCCGQGWPESHWGTSVSAPSGGQPQGRAGPPVRCHVCVHCRACCHTCVTRVTHVPQLLQIDTAGCMEVVRERKAQLPAPPPAGAQVRSEGECQAWARLAAATLPATPPAALGAGAVGPSRA